MGQRYRRMDDQKPWPVSVLKQNFPKGRLERKVKKSNLGAVLSNLVQHSSTGVHGAPKILGVHRYERVHKGASQAYRLYTQNLF